MKISEETVRHVAALARIRLTASETRRFQKDLTEIMAAFRTLDEAPNAEASFQPLPMENIMREDIIEEPLPRDVAMRNTKHKEKGFFKGPKAI